MAYTKKATEKVYTFILEQLNSGEWKAGDRIWTENMFQAHLGVSRVAVRQAIDQMTMQHRLYSVQGSGTYVCDATSQDELDLGLSADASYDELVNLLEFRKYYECATVALCIKNATESDIEELSQKYQMMLNCGEDMKVFYIADYRFHEAIAKGTKQRFIYMISKALSKVFLQNQEKLNYVIGPSVGLEYHGFILRYIQERDAELAMTYMRKHMDASIMALKSALDKHPKERN